MLRWNSQTRYGQMVASGVYLLRVEVTGDISAPEDRIARYDIYDDRLNLIYRTGELMFEEGDLMYRKGDTAYRKFVIIR